MLSLCRAGPEVWVVQTHLDFSCPLLLNIKKNIKQKKLEQFFFFVCITSLKTFNSKNESKQ